MKKIQDFLPLKVPLSLDRVYESFFDKAKKHTTYIVATSGGSDSLMVLFTLYGFLSEKELLEESTSVVVVHCNHKTRKETDQEESLVMSYLTRHIEYRGFRYRGANTTEADLRKWRWSCLEKIVKEKRTIGSPETHDVMVLTGHHLDDKIETSLLNMERGCGLWGLGNMEEFSPSAINHSLLYGTYTIARPLLHLTKQRIVEWCHTTGVKFVVDETNFDRRGGKRSLMRHFFQGKLASNAGWYDSWRSLYYQLSQYKKRLSESYLLLPVGLYKQWELDRGYEWKLHTSRSSLTFDLLVSVLHAVGFYRNTTTAGLSELVLFLGTGTSGYKVLGTMMFVVAHNRIYLFSGKVMIDGLPFWEIKPIAKPKPLDRVGECHYGNKSFFVDEAVVGGIVRYIQESDTYHGKNIKKYLLNQKVPVFFRNTTLVIEKEGIIVSVIGVDTKNE